MNEIIEYQEKLISLTGSDAWRYYPLENVVASLKKESDAPVSLIAFESKGGFGIDPYYGLPYHKHLYFINTEFPRNQFNDFLLGAGKDLIPKLEEESGGFFNTEYLPAMTFSQSFKIAEAVPTPLVTSAELKLSFSATLTALDSKIADFVELEKEFNGDFNMKVKSAYNHVYSNFKMALGHFVGDCPNEMGIKNEILFGANGGTYTSKISFETDNSIDAVAESACSAPGGIIVIRLKGKASGEYTGSCTFNFGGTEWQIDFTIGYEIEAKFRIVNQNYFNDPFETVPIEIRVPESTTVPNQYDTLSDRGVQPSFWSEHGRDIALVTVGVALIVGGALLAPESLGSSLAGGIASGGRLIMMAFSQTAPAL